MIEFIASRHLYVGVVLVLAAGAYMLLDRNLIKKIIGLNVFQTGIFLFFVTSAFRLGGRPPIIQAEGPYVNPLPHVLILTALVVGVSVTAVALGLIIRLYRAYGTVLEDEIREAMRE